MKFWLVRFEDYVTVRHNEILGFFSPKCRLMARFLNQFFLVLQMATFTGAYFYLVSINEAEFVL